MFQHQDRATTLQQEPLPAPIPLAPTPPVPAMADHL